MFCLWTPLFCFCVFRRVAGVSGVEAALELLEGGVGGDGGRGEAEAGPEGVGLVVAGDVSEVDLLGVLEAEPGGEVADELGGDSSSAVGGVDVEEVDEETVAGVWCVLCSTWAWA